MPLEQGIAGVPLGWPLVGTYFGKASSVTVRSKILNETKPLFSLTFI
jgi:hypothetical protein